MRAELQEFIRQLPLLLRMLADPTTTHTAPELYCRLDAWGWDECLPALLHELQSNDSDVKQLVLSIVCHAADMHGIELAHPFKAVVVKLLEDNDRLVRMSAILAIESLLASEPHVIAALRHIVGHDEPILANQALITLLELDPARSIIQEVAPLFRDRSV